MRSWMCFFAMHKWMHITDIVVSYNQFNQPRRIGLWQCKRCKVISKGAISYEPS